MDMKFMNGWKKARKKPIIIEYREVKPNFISSFVYNSDILQTGHFTYLNETDLDCERIVTLEGVLIAFPERDFIIKGIKGEHYPIKKDIFYETYEVLEQE